MMFLNKKYVLANELVDYMGVSIANVSMLSKKLDENSSVIIKQHNCSFIDTSSELLPNNFKQAIVSAKLDNKFTNMSNKMCVTHFNSEHALNESEVLLFGEGEVKVVKIQGKKFYEFSERMVKLLKNKILCVLDKEDCEQCLNKKQILGFKQVNNKYVAWYSLYE